MSILYLLGGAYFALLVVLLAVEDRLVFIPDRQLTETPRNHGADYEDVHVTAEDGVQLHGWWVPAAAPAPGSPVTRTRPRYSLLFMHGNAGNISDRAENAARLARLGVDILLFDYRGYGKSQGSPSEKGAYLDARAMLGHLLARPGVDPERVLFFGRSLGAAVAIELATFRTPAGLIAESPFCSVKDIAASIFPYSLWTPFIPRHFDNLARIARVKCPVMVIHGHADEIIPFHHGERVFRAAPEPKRFFDKGGLHNDLYGTDPKAYFAAFENFVESLEARRQR
ncbi:MAG: alpha/beta hydrolase [Candidatus Wallbacteria bacterium]|nr:alpha/beta hydrolase [Candidatus Wallbacteria bacterium]